MSEILKTALSLSCCGGLLILFFFLFRPFYQRHLSRQWQYYIWLVVVARLFLPFSLEINLMEALFQRIENTIVQTEPVPSAPPISSLPERKTAAGDSPLRDETDNLLAEQPMVLIGRFLWLCWPVMALILFIRKITIYQCFVNYIKTGCVEVADIQLLEHFGELIEKCRVKTTVELYTNNLISSPLLIGFFRPCIVLPDDKLSSSEFQYTILHELTHYKRRDMFYKWLVQAAVCVHWFNPFVFLMSREIEKACELSCDEAIIKNLNVQERQAYGDTLLNAISSGGSYKNSIASVTLGESRERIEERLDAIKRFQKKSMLVHSFTFVLTIIICFGTAVMGAYAAVSLPGSKLASSAKPQTIGDLTLVKNEFTMEELKKLGIYNIRIQTLSDDVTIIRGGDKLIFEYYALTPDEYTFKQTKNSFKSQANKNVYLLRTSPSKVDDERSITVTVPEQSQLEYLEVKTTSGNISLTDCTAGNISAHTQNGQIDINGGSASETFFVETKMGNAFVSGTSLPDSSKNDSYKSILNTDSGTILFQPAGSTDNYCFHIDYEEEAELIINGEVIEAGYLSHGSSNTLSPQQIEYPKGSVSGEKAEYIREYTFTYNESATKKIYFNSLKGSLIVQDK